jgi:hypothetical protein
MNRSAPQSLLFLQAAFFLPFSLLGAVNLKTLEQLNQEADLLLKKLDEISGFEKNEATYLTRLKTVDLPDLPSSQEANSPTLQQDELVDLPFVDETESINSSLSTNEEDYQDLNFAHPKNSKNKFNFYLGLSIPNDTEFSKDGKKAKFKSGVELGIEYLRSFEDESYLGGFIEGKFFESEFAKDSSTKGDNRMINFGGILGQNWQFSDSLNLKTQIGLGASSSNYEFQTLSYDKTDLSFFYAFMIGLEYRWSHYFTTSLYYELDGRAEASQLTYHTFNQFGLKAGIAF